MQRIQSKKLADVITEQLESMILDGSLLAGQKLPPERELAEQFAVSRPSLREAIQKLEAKGLIERKQGGGNYIKRRLTSAVADPILELIAKRPETQFDLLEFRHALEGMAAYYAALRGQPEHLQALQNRLDKLIALSTQSNIDAQAEALSDFYLCMAEATQNAVLQHIMRSLQPMLMENIRANLSVLGEKAEVVESMITQRKAIVAGIQAQDPELARSASNAHLAYIEQTLLEINQQDSRMQRALRRIESKVKTD